MLTRIARFTNFLALGLFVIAVCLVALELAVLNEPGNVRHVVPAGAQLPLMLAPLVTAGVALVLMGLALVRREQDAGRVSTWLASALIVVLYAVGYVWASSRGLFHDIV